LPLLPDYFLQLAAEQFLTFFANPLPSWAQVLLGHLPAVAACPDAVPLNCACAVPWRFNTDSNVAMVTMVKVFGIRPSHNVQAVDQDHSGHLYSMPAAFLASR